MFIIILLLSLCTMMLIISEINKYISLNQRLKEGEITELGYFKGKVMEKVDLISGRKNNCNKIYKTYVVINSNDANKESIICFKDYKMYRDLKINNSYKFSKKQTKLNNKIYTYYQLSDISISTARFFIKDKKNDVKSFTLNIFIILSLYILGCLSALLIFI